MPFANSSKRSREVRAKIETALFMRFAANSGFRLSEPVPLDRQDQPRDDQPNCGLILTIAPVKCRIEFRFGRSGSITRDSRQKQRHRGRVVLIMFSEQLGE